MESDIARLLRQRGHEVTKEGSRRDILLPENDDAELVEAFETILYNLMRRDSARKALRDWAYSNPSSNNAALRQIESYITLCRRFGDWSNQSDAANQKRYAATFEWYVSQLLKREFAARASGFGIRLKDAHPDDEFDCIALLDAGLAYVECKTGKGTLYGEIAKFVRRDSEICANVSLFVFDRDYTFDKGQTDAPRISEEQAKALGLDSIYKVHVGGEEFFRIAGIYKREDTYDHRDYDDEYDEDGGDDEYDEDDEDGGDDEYDEDDEDGGDDEGDGQEEIDSRFFLACTAFRGFENRIRYMIRYSSELQEEGRPLSSIFSWSLMPFPDEPALDTTEG